MVKIGMVVNNEVCEDGESHMWGCVKDKLIGCNKCKVVCQVTDEKTKEGYAVLVRVDGQKFGGK